MLELDALGCCWPGADKATNLKYRLMAKLGGKRTLTSSYQVLSKQAKTDIHIGRIEETAIRSNEKA